jgi:hypothetical protein
LNFLKKVKSKVNPVIETALIKLKRKMKKKWGKMDLKHRQRGRKQGSRG